MGMDMYIDKIKRDPTDKSQVIERTELCYWRKFWDLHRSLPFEYGDDEYGKDVRIRKQDIEEILQYVSHNRDYFGEFNTVSSVCELLDNYDELQDEGYEIVYNADW